ncbi:MAG: hypothetical protein ACREID_00870, partial [Planctomycetota bacterium]
ASFRGRAAAVAGGTQDVEETLATLRLSATHRYGLADDFGGGIVAYPGAPGDAPVGAWVALHLGHPDPFRELTVRLHAHELLAEPAAAVGLGGRSDGVEATGQTEIGKHWWAAADLGFESLSLDEPAGGTARDGRFTGRALLGFRVLEGAFKHANLLDIDPSPFPGLVSPDLAPGAGEDGPALSVWASYYGIRLLGDQELAALVPIGESFDYLALSARLDAQLASGLGGKVEAYVGTELQEGTLVWGVDAGLTFKTPRALELSATASFGQALGRADADATAGRILLGVTWRW